MGHGLYPHLTCVYYDSKIVKYDVVTTTQCIGKIYFKYILKIFKIKYIIIHFKVEKRKIIYLNIFQKYI